MRNIEDMTEMEAQRSNQLMGEAIDMLSKGKGNYDEGRLCEIMTNLAALGICDMEMGLPEMN